MYRRMKQELRAAWETKSSSKKKDKAVINVDGGDDNSKPIADDPAMATN